MRTDPSGSEKFILAAGRSVLPVQLMRLEDRIVLEASGLADSGSADHSAAPHQAPDAPDASDPVGAADAVGPPPIDGATDGKAGASPSPAVPDAGSDGSGPTAPRLVVICPTLDQASTLAGATSDGVLHTIAGGPSTTLEALLAQIRAALGEQTADSIALAAHGDLAGGFELAGGLAVNLDTLEMPQMRAFWLGLAELIRPGGRIDLLACHVAAGPDGQNLVAALEDLTGVDFAASDDATGHGALGGNWVLETDQVDAAAVYFDAARLAGFTEILESPPTITDTNPGNTAVGGEGAVVVDAGITVTPGDTGNLQGAAVRIKSGFVAGEDLLRVDEGVAAGKGITWTYDDAHGALYLSGSASAEDYQAVLRTVTYQNLSATPDTTPREIFFVIGDDFDDYRYYAANGHYYRLVNSAVTWITARNAADAQSVGGLQGYLTTITSAGENALVHGMISAYGRSWIGASDADVEGAWYWVTGPESGTQFWQGNQTGGPVGEAYNNWNTGEPNDWGTGEDYAEMRTDGKWNDMGGSHSNRYVVEYGGLSTDTEGQLAASVLVNVVAPNHAPVLDNTGIMSLTPINEDAFSNPGDTVAGIIASAGGDRITDPDPDALEGIALIGVDSTYGRWEYSLDGGLTWLAVGAVSNDNALLLRDTDRLRFVPDPDWNGTLADGITFRAWDQTSGSAGDYADASVNGGNTAFSLATETADLVVHPVNDAPVLDNSGQMSLLSINEDDFDNAGTSVAAMIASAGGDRITDVDAGALEGIALVGVHSAYGTWQYSLDGGLTWHNVGAVSVSHALLLRDSDLIRFVPNPDWNGTLTDALSFRAWDQTSGSAGGYADTTAPGGTSAFSLAMDTAKLVVNPVNDAPTVTSPLVDQITAEDAAFTYKFAANTFSDVDGDALSYSATLADGSPLPSWLIFDPATRTFYGTPGNDDVGTLNIKVTASDGHGGVVSDTFALTVTNTNDAPVVANPLVDQAAAEGTLFRYQFAANSFVDVDVGDTLTYSATLADGSPLPSWLIFDPATRTFYGTPGNDDAGLLSVKVTARDNHGASAFDVFTITVSATAPPESPPPEPPPPEAPPPEPPPPEPQSPVVPAPNNSSSAGSSAPADAAASSSTTASAVADVGGAVATADASPGGGEAAEAGDTGPATDGATVAESSEAGGESSAGGDGKAAAGPAVAGGVAAAAHGPTTQDVRYHEREEAEFDVTTGALVAEINSAMFSGELLSDATQPGEFREAWNTILSAYLDGTEEVSAYLQSAFRAVTESALIYQQADQALAALEHELALAAEAGLEIDADELLAAAGLAQADVRRASAELEGAIRAAAEAGKEDRFDQVLKDVVSAALERLMSANQRLFVESQALAAVVAALRDARAGGAGPVDEANLSAAADQARESAQAEMVEMRKSWDRVAQDVFSAFVARLAAERAGPGAGSN